MTMRKHLKTSLVASTLAAGIAAAPTIYAHDSNGSDGSMMGQGGMMGPMSSMMDHCNEVMQAMNDSENGGQRPNEQWRERAPQLPDRPR